MNRPARKSLWGIGLFSAYGIFVAGVLALVLYASIQSVDMAEEHPYELGLAYQGRIDQLSRAAALDSNVSLIPRADGRALRIKLPEVGRDAEVSGEVRLLRPSNERLDRRWILDVDSSGAQEIATAGLARGLWRLEVEWTVDATAYYFESKLVLP